MKSLPTSASTSRRPSSCSCSLHPILKDRNSGQRGVKLLEKLPDLESTRKLKVDAQMHPTGSTQRRIE